MQYRFNVAYSGTVDNWCQTRSNIWINWKATLACSIHQLNIWPLIHCIETSDFKSEKFACQPCRVCSHIDGGLHHLSHLIRITLLKGACRPFRCQQWLHPCHDGHHLGRTPSTVVSPSVQAFFMARFIVCTIEWSEFFLGILLYNLHHLEGLRENHHTGCQDHWLKILRF